MAKAKTKELSSFRAKARRKRKGIHAKTKSSSHKHSKNYIKLSRGQG